MKKEQIKKELIIKILNDNSDILYESLEPHAERKIIDEFNYEKIANQIIESIETEQEEKCSKCGADMIDKFTSEKHDYENCHKKKKEYAFNPPLINKGKYEVEQESEEKECKHEYVLMGESNRVGVGDFQCIKCNNSTQKNI